MSDSQVLDDQQQDDGQGAAEPTLRETLESAFEQHAGEDDLSNQGEKPEARTGKPRDQSGRFAKTEPHEQQAAADAAAAATQQQSGQQTEDIPPPAGWKAEAKAQWANLPAEVRKYINEREAEVHRGFTRNDEERNLGKSMREALQPYEATFKQLGVAPQQVVSHVLGFEAVLRTGTPEQKLNAMHLLARDYGIPLQAVMQHRPNLPDPALANVQAELLQLRQAEQQRQQQHEQQQLAQAQQEVDSFREKNPHFESVRADMHDLIAKGLAGTLQEAYDIAVFRKPELRSAVIAGGTRQVTKANEQQQRAASARRAGASVSGSPAGSRTAMSEPAGSLRDELVKNMRAATGRI
jgi:hypothetical protein